MPKTTSHRLLMAVAILITSAQPASAGTRGACLQADVPAPIVLPDGTVNQRGLLRICLTQMYSPVAGLHKTSIDGSDIGVFISRAETQLATADDRQPYFVFIRNSRGQLELDSYVLLDGARRVTYKVGPEPRVESTWRVERETARLPFINDEETSESVVVLAAVAH
jgi:hypothetical protein